MTLGRERLTFDADVPIEARVAAVSDAQHGPISSTQLRLCGISEAGIGRRHRRGMLHRIHRGVYVPGHSGLFGLGWIAAALLACGPSASGCRLTAAHVRDLRSTSRALVDVAVASPNGRAHALVDTFSSRNLRPQDISVVDGIPVTCVARTLLDCAPLVGSRGIEQMVLEAERIGTFDLAAIKDLLAHVPGHTGRRILREAIGEAAAARGHTASPFEDDLRVEFRAVGLDEPECNPPIFLPDGSVVYPDFLWRDGALVVEADPQGTHDTTASYRSDRVRDRRLDAIGLQTMRFNDVDLRDPRACALETQARLKSRRAENYEFRSLSEQNS